MATRFLGLIDRLLDHDVEFLLIGGVALVLHGSARSTQDLDICYSRNDRNLRRLQEALAELHPRLRGAPADLPFHLDTRTLRSGLNFTLTTEAGDLDLIGEVPGAGTFEQLAPTAQPMQIAARRVLVLGLDELERSKRAAGRLKDTLDLAEIGQIRARAKNR